MQIDNNILIAFGLTLFAGLSTGIGSAIAFFARRTNTKFLSISLGFSAGVMIYVSFVEIFFEAKESLVAGLGKTMGTWVTVISFFVGMFFIALVDRILPSAENPHDFKSVEDMTEKERSKVLEKQKLMRIGILTGLAIAIHNFPEGIATFTASMTDIKLGVAIAIAIAIHNIPEGIAVSVPIYYATGDRRKAFIYSFLSGLAEPVGALFGYLLLTTFITPALFGIILAWVAGIMVFISLKELLPAAREYGEPHLAMYGLLSGMAVMAVSLLLFI